MYIENIKDKIVLHIEVIFSHIINTIQFYTINSSSMFKKIRTIYEILKNKGPLHTISRIYYYLIIKPEKIRRKLAYKYIKWVWIEIGWLHNPCHINKNKAQVKYVDYLDEDWLKNNYTELANSNLQKIDYICMADNLDKISSDSQDFVIWNHLFEHLNDPIKTLIEWYRVLKNNGIIFMAIPDKRRTFDVDRERTKLEHLIADYKEPSETRDWQHYLEFASIGRADEEKINLEAKKLKETNYSIHYHVFIEEDIQNIIDWCNKNTGVNFSTIEVKHTSKNIWDNEFIFILQAIK